MDHIPICVAQHLISNEKIHINGRNVIFFSFQFSKMSLESSIIFQPLQVGDVKLSNRIFFAPSTRFRALADGTSSDLNLEYYDQRSKYPGSLVITEGTSISEKYGLHAFEKETPGIYTQKHIKAWKKITDQIHANGSYVSVQLFAAGRVSRALGSKAIGNPIFAPSPIFASEQAELAAKNAGVEIHELTTDEIKEVQQHFVQAAKNAVAAGFDFVEIHGANGYLVDQFNMPSSNKRSDQYGGSIENRSRFVLELVDTLSEEVGANKVGLRLSPWNRFQGMLAEDDEVSPVAQFGYLLDQLQKRATKGREIAYISLVEARYSGTTYGDNDFVSSVWKGVQLRAGGYGDDAPEFTKALKDAEKGNTAIGFSRHYISNPDLVSRIQNHQALTKYDRETFYTLGNWGYNTYVTYGSTKTFSEENEKQRLPKALA